MESKVMLIDGPTLKRSVMRISHEIVERNKGTDRLVIIGIRRRGKVLGEMIRDCIEKIEGVRLPCADLDISFYRDDLSKISDAPVTVPPELPFSVTGMKVILVDDVLYTGRTVRAAIEAIFSQGRPDEIQLAILIDRGHRELPFRADFVGRNIPTSRLETVKVMIPPYDEETGVYICGKGSAPGTSASDASADTRANKI